MDTGTYFTTWGQACLLVLIQLGVVGILTFTTLTILALGGRLSLQLAMHDILSDLMQPVPDPDAPLRSDTLIVAGTDESLAQAAQIT